MRRARVSQGIVSGTADAELTTRAAFAGWTKTSVSVIGLSLLPLAPSETEVAEQGREHEERNHRDGNGGPLTQFTACDSALKSQRCQQVRRVDRPAAGDC